MPLFLSFHSFPIGAFSMEQVTQMARMGQESPTVRGHYSTGNLQEGKAVCTFEASTRDELVKWFGTMGMPFDTILPAQWEGERGDIRPV